MAPDCGRWEMVRLAFGLALGQLQPERDFALHCGSDIILETRQRHRHVICDGELQRVHAPFHFSLRKDALRVIVPSERAPIAEPEQSLSASEKSENDFP
jgi:diacylglycerol kinase family enzyme